MKIGVVGRTGAGKSTFAITLSRILYPESGRILVDGVDIQTIQLSELRRTVTVIPQDPTLFKGSLRSNIDPNGEFTEVKMLQLIEKAGLPGLLKKPLSSILEVMV